MPAYLSPSLPAVRPSCAAAPGRTPAGDSRTAASRRPLLAAIQVLVADPLLRSHA
ncbi:hypothetical protein ACP4OV_023586 [Aristida adscensionis]